MAVFTGAGVSIVTPFHTNGDINYEKLEELIDVQCKNETDAIIVCGTTGEAATLTEEERKRCIERAVRFGGGRLPIIAGIGCNDTKMAMERARIAKQAGADALLVVTPYYNKATQEGLVAHYTAIAKETALPMILYNVPSRTGCNLEAETVAALIRTVDNIVGIKEASGNLSQVAKILNLTNGEAEVYAGNDEQIVPVLALGGAGVISVLSNIAPRETHQICKKYLAGDRKGSVELQLRAFPLIEALFCQVNPIPVKKALNLLGYEVGGLRLPLTELGETHTKRLAEAMKAFGIMQRMKIYG